MVVYKFLVVLLALLLYFQASESFRIGAFNVRVFGKSKASKPEVMDMLSKIIRRYDIILIQEIRDSKGTAIKTLLDQVNRDSRTGSYGMIISERLGRTTSKEQYAFFYRNSAPDEIEVVSSYVYDDGDEADGDDHFEREPFLVKFYAKHAVVKTFVLGAIHVKPETAVAEITKLEDVFDDAKLKFKTDNILILGDLNADCTYVPKKAWPTMPIKNDPKFHWLIGDEADTTVKESTDCAYDRFILTGSDFYDAVITRSVKTFRFDTHYKMTESEALQVSDHYPIEVDLLPIVVNEITDLNDESQPIGIWILTVIGIIIALIFKQRQH